MNDDTKALVTGLLVGAVATVAIFLSVMTKLHHDWEAEALSARSEGRVEALQEFREEAARKGYGKFVVDPTNGEALYEWNESPLAKPQSVVVHGTPQYERRIKDMEVGEVGWITPWTVKNPETGELWMDWEVIPEKSAPASTKIERTESGYEVTLQEDYLWERPE